MMSVAIIGKNSFLAGGLKKAAERAECDQGWFDLSHDQALASTHWLGRAKCVINFAFDPYLSKQGYDPAHDIDSRIARQVARIPGVHYVMISSRKVYGPMNDSTALSETCPLRPDTPYGQAKAEIEYRLSDLLPETRLTILRPSNIFGPEYGRQSFFGMALTRLVDEGRIVFDFNPVVRRDFLSIRQFGQNLLKIVRNPVGGVYNLGAGFGMECGKIAQWLINGFGSGMLEITDNTAKDEFWLDMTKSNAAFDLPVYDENQLRKDCHHVIDLTRQQMTQGQ